MANCLFHCGCASGTPYCPVTVRLLDCDSTPIQGATVTVSYCESPSARTPVVGTTGANGTYTLPADTTFPLLDCFTIAWDGLTAGPFYGVDSSAYNCTHTVDFSYRHAKVTVTTLADPSAVVSAGPLGLNASGQGTGTVVLSYQWIGYRAYRSPFPATVGITSAADNSRWLDNCTTLTLNCGDNVAASLPLFEWDTNYAVHDFGCDQTCSSRGEGPNYRGVMPKKLFVTITADDAASATYIGNYNGASIPVTWDGAKWDSGCLASPGIPCTANTYGAYYQSARLTIGPADSYGVFPIAFLAMGNADCTSPATYGDCSNGLYIASSAHCELASPVDATVGGSVVNTYIYASFQIHITE